MKKKLSLKKVGEIYFGQWEIDRALESGKPIEKLISLAKKSCRGSSGPNRLGYMTFGNNIELYLPETSVTSEADYILPIKDVAQALIESITQKSLF